MQYINPYKKTVQKIVLRGFAALNAGNYRVITRQCHENAVYEFEGEHSLGGVHKGRQAIEGWFEKLLYELPSTFTIHEVIVMGFPWDTTVIVQFSDEVRPRNSEPYQNHGVQLITLKWGKIRHIHTYADTFKIARALSDNQNQN